MTPATVNSIPWMPERAWTVARAACAISGLTRSDYSPENVQSDPPCEGPEAIPSCDADCLPRYVPWRECPRNPDFAGGEPLTVWTREPGWTQANTCVTVEPLAVEIFVMPAIPEIH